MKKLATLATGAVAFSAIVPVLAATDGSTTTVGVNETTLTIVGGNFDFGAGIPGDTVDASADVTVTTNNDMGYTVSLDLSDLTKAGVRKDGDLVAATAIDATVVSYTDKTENTADANEAAGSTATGMNDDEQIAASGIRSLETGDDFTVTLETVLPWIEDGTYAGTATFTATAL
jgi:hypothetical protein